MNESESTRARAFLEDYYRRTLSQGGSAMTGQLTDAFQATLETAHADRSERDCHFYHTLEFPDGSVIPGGWDLRGRERAYLGWVDVRGRRVLDVGPATGHLGFYMEGQGAEVTAFDVAPGMVQNLLPQAGSDLDANQASGAAFAEQVRNSWWLGRRRHGSRARAVYGDIEALPADMGRYDIAFLCSILLHLANPFAVLRQVAAVADRGVVVTDVAPPLLYGGEAGAVVEFNPGEEPGNLVNWWGLSPGAVARMLRVLGFARTTVRFHEIRFHRDHDPAREQVQRFMFTVIGERRAGDLAFLEPTDEERDADRTVRRLIPVLTLEQLKAQAAMARELDAIHRSLAWKAMRPLRGVGRLFGRR